MILKDLGTGLAMVPIIAILEQVAIAKAFCESLSLTFLIFWFWFSSIALKDKCALRPSSNYAIEYTSTRRVELWMDISVCIFRRWSCFFWFYDYDVHSQRRQDGLDTRDDSRRDGLGLLFFLRMHAADGVLLPELGHVCQRSQNSICQFLQRFVLFLNIKNILFIAIFYELLLKFKSFIDSFGFCCPRTRPCDIDSTELPDADFLLHSQIRSRSRHHRCRLLHDWIWWNSSHVERQKYCGPPPSSFLTWHVYFFFVLP